MPAKELRNDGMSSRQLSLKWLREKEVLYTVVSTFYEFVRVSNFFFKQLISPMAISTPVILFLFTDYNG